PETYVHRIGRTGRSGQGGEAVSFCDHVEQPRLKAIERLIRMAIERRNEPTHEGFEAAPQSEGPRQRGRRGSRSGRRGGDRSRDRGGRSGSPSAAVAVPAAAPAAPAARRTIRKHRRAL
ncbi:MAG: hypothetical protein ACKOEX_13585, partial [Planctomycetia bacterium]